MLPIPRKQPFFSRLFIFRSRLSIIAKGMDAYTAAGCEKPCYFDVLRFHQSNQVFHNDIDAVFVESAMIPKTEQIEFQAFAFYHFNVRNIIDQDSCKIRLSGNGTKAGKFRAVKMHPIIILRMLVDKSF